MTIWIVQKTCGKILYATCDEHAAEEVANKCRSDHESVNVHEVSVVGSFKVPTLKGDIVVTETDPQYPGVNICLVPREQPHRESTVIATIGSDPEDCGVIHGFWYGDPDNADIAMCLQPKCTDSTDARG